MKTTVTVIHTIQTGINDYKDLKKTKVFEDTATLLEIKQWAKESINVKKEKPYTIYNVIQSFFWWNAFSATLVLPILPLITAYREWRYIELQKNFECSKWISEFKIKKMWWKLVKIHYQMWYERLKRYKSEREKIQLSSVA